jgi:hypothetical protein
MSDARAPTDDSKPLMHRYRWQLDALRCGLADSMHALREAEAVLVQLRELQRAARNGAAAVSDRLDPLHMRAVVTYLGQLVERIQQQTWHRDQLISLCSLKRRDCAEAEAQLEEIEAQAAQTVRLGLEGLDGQEGQEDGENTNQPTCPAHPDRRDRPHARRTAPSRVIEMLLPGV